MLVRACVLPLCARVLIAMQVLTKLERLDEFVERSLSELRHEGGDRLVKPAGAPAPAPAVAE